MDFWLQGQEPACGLHFSSDSNTIPQKMLQLSVEFKVCKCKECFFVNKKSLTKFEMFRSPKLNVHKRSWASVYARWQHVKESNVYLTSCSFPSWITDNLSCIHANLIIARGGDLCLEFWCTFSWPLQWIQQLPLLDSHRYTSPVEGVGLRPHLLTPVLQGKLNCDMTY